MLPNILRFKANHLIDFFCLVGPYICLLYTSYVMQDGDITLFRFNV